MSLMVIIFNLSNLEFSNTIQMLLFSADVISQIISSLPQFQQSMCIIEE